jgi:hypothetical protein
MHYCFSVGSSFGPGLDVNNNLLELIVSHVWHGVIKHKHDEDAQETGRSLLSYLVGKESAAKMRNAPVALELSLHDVLPSGLRYSGLEPCLLW